MSENVKIIDTESVISSLPKRLPDSNKGSFGRALLICGSYGMAGAAIIAARACIHSGAGIVNVVCPKSIYQIIAPAVPEAVFTPVNDELTDEDISAVKSAIDKSTAAAIGCGCGKSEYTLKLLKTVIKNAKIPTIIDADGINCLSENIDLLQSAEAPIILTPHPGEMSRLCQKSISEIQGDRINTAKKFAFDHSLTLVLKGHETVTADRDGEIFVNQTGNAGMATAGSGDMLCGIMAALLAQKMPVLDAVNAAVHIHGICGDLSAKKYSMAYTTPTTMTEFLAEIFKKSE